jgi:hypothetical protein
VLAAVCPSREAEGAMRVQRLLMPGSGTESWTLLGDEGLPVERLLDPTRGSGTPLFGRSDTWLARRLRIHGMGNLIGPPGRRKP